MPWFKMGDVPNPLFDANGNPANGFILKAYDPETDNATSIAINADGDSLQASITANAEGKWEVSSNEIIPHINKKHKWGIFENATHAAANTPFYMGPFDNVEVKSSSTEHYLDSVSLMQNDPSIAVGHVVVTKEFSTGNGGGGTYDVVLTSSVTPNGFNIIQGVADATISFSLRVGDTIYAKQFGLVGDGSSSALQVLIDATPSGGAVDLGQGSYKLETAVSIAKPLTLKSSGAEIITDSGYTIGIEVTSPNVIIDNIKFTKVEQTDRFNIVVLINESDCTVKNCNFVGNGKTVAEYGRGTGLQFGKGTTDPSTLRVLTCNFIDYEFCIKTATSKNMLIDNCSFSGGIDPTYAAANYGTSSLGDGIKASLDLNDDATATGTDYTGILGVSVSNCSFVDMERDGIDLYYRGSNINVSNCLFAGRINKALDIKVIYTSTDTSIPDIRQTRAISVTNNQFYNLTPINYVIDVITTTDGTITLDDANVTQAVVISDNVFEMITTPLLSITDSSSITFTDNIIKDYDAASNDEGIITITGSSAPVMRQFNFSGNQIRIFDDAIDLQFVNALSAAGDIEHVSISNNTYYGGEDDIFIKFENNSNSNFMITGNIVQGNLDTTGSFGANHMLIKDLTNANISNNTLEWCNLEGIRLNGAYNVRIMNNIIGNCGQTAARKEIRIEDGTNVAVSDHVYIKFNTLHDNGTTTEGVDIGGTGLDIVVSDNDTF